MSSTIDTTALLTQLGSLARQAGIPPAQGVGVTPDSTPIREPAGVSDAQPQTDFGELVGDSLRAVNDRGQQAQSLVEAFDRGHPDVELADVMIAVQKARVSFEALSQVRNKMVSAYQEVMNTPL